jgi:SAM-dependent methyltransferase
MPHCSEQYGQWVGTAEAGGTTKAGIASSLRGPRYPDRSARLLARNICLTRGPAALCGNSTRMADYRDVNRASWDERVPAHVASPDYAVERFFSDPSFLSEVVQFDLPRLGDISGLRGVHLQCHIGTDTVSLARLGASMTGLDFSAPAVTAARTLASSTGADATFVRAEVYDAADVLGRGGFDLVYTGIGALGWLPDIRRWAAVVADLLRPGGRLFIREGHPMLWTLDDERSDDLLAVRYPYFEQAEPNVFDLGGTYVSTDVVFSHNVTHEWNHGLGEIMTALFDAGLAITAFTEHDSVPWNALPGKMERTDDGEWRLTDDPSRVPCSYTLQALKHP